MLDIASLDLFNDSDEHEGGHLESSSGGKLDCRGGCIRVTRTEHCFVGKIPMQIPPKRL